MVMGASDVQGPGLVTTRRGLGEDACRGRRVDGRAMTNQGLAGRPTPHASQEQVRGSVDDMHVHSRINR